jgi:hypothetical protein
VVAILFWFATLIYIYLSVWEAAILFWFATLIYIYLSVWEVAILFWFSTFYLPYLGRGFGGSIPILVEAGGVSYSLVVRAL